MENSREAATPMSENGLTEELRKKEPKLQRSFWKIL